MKVTHTFEIEARCPSISGHVDHYECILTLDRFMKVEDIRPKLERILAEPIFQEPLAEAILSTLGATSVRLEGPHPGGFRTIVEID